MKEPEHISAKEFQYIYYGKKGQRKNKFGAKKAIIDNQKFDSKSEGDLYCQLKLQQRAGLIESFEQQVKEEFWAYGKHICDYYVDFLVYHLDGTREYIEHKGKSTDAWKIKWKMLVAKYEGDKQVKCSINWYQSKNQFKKKHQYQPKF